MTVTIVIVVVIVVLLFVVATTLWALAAAASRATPPPDPRCGALLQHGYGTSRCMEPVGHDGQHRAPFPTGPLSRVDGASDVILTWRD